MTKKRRLLTVAAKEVAQNACANVSSERIVNIKRQSEQSCGDGALVAVQSDADAVSAVQLITTTMGPIKNARTSSQCYNKNYYYNKIVNRPSHSNKTHCGVGNNNMNSCYRNQYWSESGSSKSDCCANYNSKMLTTCSENVGTQYAIYPQDTANDDALGGKDQRTVIRLLQESELQAENVLQEGGDDDDDAAASAWRQPMHNKNKQKGNYNHTYALAKRTVLTKYATAIPHSTNQQIYNMEQRVGQQASKPPQEQAQQQQQHQLQQSQVLITPLSDHLQASTSQPMTSSKATLPSVGKAQLRSVSAKSTTKVGAKNVLIKFTWAAKAKASSATATATTTTATNPLLAATKTKRATKSLKSAFECPSTGPSAYTLNDATATLANCVTPATTTTTTSTIASVTHIPAPITTATTLNTSWATISEQLLATIEQLCCRSSKSTANSNNNNAIASGFVWLLPLLCLLAAFGCGQAGFACLSNPCVFGVCIDGLNSSYSCYCIDGYTGIQCQTNWDECWSGPCQNGGTCIDGVAYYNCTCPDGFTGINCEENVDECMSNPCQNGGHCRDRNNGYTCTCQPGYLGINCEVDVAVCETGTGARCQNGGECIEGPGLEFSCECTAGWHGRICQEEINECESAPCQNGGVCVDKLASYVCACPMGYTGNNCEEEILICADNPCQNNALCLMEESIPTCYCVPDYHGEKCEYQYDECQLGPRCMNGGVCIDGVDTFSCSCPPLLTGMLCECLMIGEDSLDCNYTVTISTMPPTTIVRPMITTSAATITTTTEATPHVSVVGLVTTTAPTSAVSTSVETEETEEEQGEVGSEKGKPPPEQVTKTSSSISTSSEEKTHTTESSRSYTAESGSSVESSYSSEGSASVEVGTSDEYTTVARFDSRSSQEVAPTTAKTAISGAESDYTPPSLPVSKSIESEERPIITYSTRPPFKHYVTTIETTFSVDLSTARPTYRPTTAILYPSSTVHILPAYPGKHLPTEYPEYPDHEVTTTPHRIWTDKSVPTTAAPFFTEYPEVSATTRYKDFSTVTTARPTTYPPPPPLPSVTPAIVHGGTTLRPQIGAETSSVTVTPTAGVTAERPVHHHHHHHHHHHTTHTPQTGVEDRTHPPHTTETHYHHVEHTTHRPYYHVDEGVPTTAAPPKAPTVMVTTTHPLYTEDLVSHTTTSRPATTTVAASAAPTTIVPEPESAEETTQPPPQPPTLPPSSSTPAATTPPPPTLAPTTTPVAVATYPPPTEPALAPVTATPSYTTLPSPPAPTAPSPSVPVYSTYTPPSIKPITTTVASSEEVESSNTVATGGEAGTARGGGTPVGGAGGVDNATEVDCIKMGCYNGGTCVTTSEGSRCVCRFDRQGALCELPIIIKNAAFSGDSYVSHRIHKDIPHHESLDSVLPMHVQLKVRTRATNGLIMLAAAQGTKGGHYMALFLQKGLLQFQFSCGLQTMLLSELETPVNTGNEITIRAELDFSRNFTHCNASLLVNDTLAMSGDQPTWLKLLPPRMHTPEVILNTWLHLGGAPQAPIGLIIELPPAQSGTGFTGCLHSLRINEETREIFGDALDGFGITECGSLACLSSPCRNGAACIKIETNEVDENGEKAEKWKCKCPTGYMGPTCEISVCEDNPCQYGGTCVQFPGSGYLCLCPLGKHGHYCEHNFPPHTVSPATIKNLTDLEVALPSFSGSVNGLSSFVAYTVPIPLEYSIELSFKILPQTMSQISLLAFLGQTGYHDEKSDHLAISFIQGYIMLTWNLGGGPRRIFTQKPIDFRLDAPRVPYEIKVGRIGRQAWLSVDGKFNITGRSPGSVNRMDVMPILYLGGHEIANFNTLPHDLPLHSGFQGCIYDVNLKAGQVTVPLQETRGVRGRGVGQCGTRECHRHACQHDGACLQHGATFTCICQEGWYGPLCAQPINPCDSFNNKCAEGSTCVPLVNGYECDCPVGRTGKNCDEDIRSLSDVSLTGRRSYLSVRWPYLYDSSDKLGSKRSQIISYRNFTKKLMPPKPIASSNQHFVMKLLNEVEKQRNFSPVPLMGSKTFEEHHRVQFFFIEFQLRPLSERGLLLYFGTLNNNLDKKVGFVSLSLQGGVVEFRISGPNSHVTVVRSVRMLAIGEWHKIKMAQRGRWLTLWVEGSASSALAPSAEVLVEPDSLLYIGGLKDLSKLPHNAISGFPIPFRGCVRGLVVSGTRIVLNETNIIDSRNIRDCDGTACGGDSCEAGGHCWLDEKLQPHCICPEYAKGDRCEYSESCKLIPCKNNGRCLRSGRCSCPNGWGGFYCEIAMSKPTTPSFRGNSYLILPPPRIPMKDKRRGPSMYVRPREAIQVSLNFSTIEPDGLLLWSEHDRNKFLGLGLENGHLKMASNLLDSSNDTVQMPSTGFIADGSWHLAKVMMDRNRLELQLDGEVIFSEKVLDAVGTGTALSTTERTMLTTRRSFATRRGKEPSITYEDVFYLGGFPNQELVSERTLGRFNEPFKGCLQDIQFGAEPNAVITDFSPYKGENIGSCDLHGDEPMVVV
ncbi:protein eyes shut isoform X2 [Anastrepha ludens]|uniref:protein eyes shut isoform X2 n=1 Tax=Anastrepha ludens TaxID=28586 RepID=UPI0023B1D514|nr:protein eyes shut isoform X2 [Anastrepha ludens]